jgi:exo-beta-1,3-glucanase (GH17 family)
MSDTRERSTIGLALASFVLTAFVVCGVWWWLGGPIQIASPTASVGKPYCLSYAPFRDAQNPLVEGTRVEAAQIEEDLALLSKYTDCIRTYSVDDGRADVLESARRHGLKVLHGIWVSSDPAKTRQQIETTVALAKAYPDVIAAIVVGNEVLLRGEMSSTDLVGYIRQVKAQVPMPVTYADVWEFWLRYPDVQSVVDFVTIHVLPYWEDFPIPATRAAAHVAAIRERVAAAFPGKEIVIGEFGWPSAGRMREDARPSPSNQARAILETMALAKRKNFRMNVIEAFDQPWKRALEGAVGGYWGIIDRATGAPKFSFDGTVSDHPHWVVQALAGVLLAALTFGAAFFAGREKGVSAAQWLRIAALAIVPAILFGWTIEAVTIDSFSPGSWLRSLAFAAIAAAAPIVCAAACAAGHSTPSFASLLGDRGRRDGLDWALGGTLIALMLVTVEAALGLVFDPRYRDIPFAPMTGAVVPLLVLLASMPRPPGQRAVAETAAAAVLAASAVYIVFNETFANWQAVWFCGALIGLAVILALARDAPSSG